MTAKPEPRIAADASRLTSREALAMDRIARAHDLTLSDQRDRLAAVCLDCQSIVVVPSGPASRDAHVAARDLSCCDPHTSIVLTSEPRKFDAEHVHCGSPLCAGTDAPEPTEPTDLPALNGEPVTERHARLCADQGHATHTLDGQPVGTCPRCGEVTEPEPVTVPVSIDEAVADPHNVEHYRAGSGTWIAVESVARWRSSLHVRYALGGTATAPEHHGARFRRIVPAEDPCGCESREHFDGTDHPYVAAKAGDRLARYVGRICDPCADGHLAAYVVAPEPEAKP